MHGIGTIVNVITVVIGSSLGLLLGERLPKAMNEIAMQVLGAVTLVLGMQMALEGGSAVMMILVLLALVTGSFIGEWMDIEGIMNRLGERFEKRFNRDRSDEDAGARFVQGFVSASLLFVSAP